MIAPATTTTLIIEQMTHLMHLEHTQQAEHVRQEQMPHIVVETTRGRLFRLSRGVIDVSAFGS
jgi:hypothetical protein